MPRTARASAGGYWYHVLNRGAVEERRRRQGRDKVPFRVLVVVCEVWVESGHRYFRDPSLRRVPCHASNGSRLCGRLLLPCPEPWHGEDDGDERDITQISQNTIITLNGTLSTRGDICKGGIRDSRDQTLA